jgi:MYXO-CTERM domain-containing protein
LKPFAAFFAVFAAVAGASSVGAAAPFKIFMISSEAPDHLAMSAAARTALAQMGQTSGFTVDATTDPTLINDANLAGYDVFLQMHLAPFEINLEQRVALEHFIQQGKGWVGIHGAGLIIPSSYVKRNYPNWELYSNLLGGITYSIHPALQNGTVAVEDRMHPATKNLPATFQIRDEWYEWDKTPRPNVRVLGKADERTYTQVNPMGDHPMIWTCEKYQRTLYIGIGHDAADWQNANFNILVRDALLWAATGTVTPLPTSDGGSDAAVVGPGDREAGSDASMGSVGTGGANAGTGGDGGSTGQGGASSPGASGASGASGVGGASSSAGTGGSSSNTTSSSVVTGAGGVGGATVGATPESTSGCSCSIAGSSGARSSSLLVFLGIAFAARKRRKASRSLESPPSEPLGNTRRGGTSQRRQR